MNINTKQLHAERAIHLSLDEYIKESNIYISPMLKQPKINSNMNDNELTKKSARDGAHKFTDDDYIMDEEEEEDDILNIKTDDALFENNFDLRNKLNNVVSSEENLPNAKSPSWRLMAPNTSQNRPAGMAPLIPSLLSKEREMYCLNERKNIAQENYRAKPEIIQNNSTKFNHNNKRNLNRRNNYYYNNNNNNNNNNRNMHYNNRNFMRNHQNKTMNDFSHSICRMVDGSNPKNVWQTNGLNNNNWNNNNNNNNNWNNNNNNNNLNEKFINTQPTLLKPQHPPLVFDPTPAEVAIKNGLGILNNCSGSNMSLIPQIASKLLEVIGTSSKPEPKYDMKIQREIHTLQRKQMIYRCPDGEVISSDGPGVGYVQLKPSSTGITLNQRFA